MRAWVSLALAGAAYALVRLARAVAGHELPPHDDVTASMAQALFWRYGSVKQGEFKPYDHWMSEAEAIIGRMAEYPRG